jgi:Ca2+-binding EF-hand superfamily protein
MVKEARSRLYNLSRGGDPVFLRKIFDDFDLDQSGRLTIDEATSMIAKLQISVERKYVHPFFKVIDADNSGDIEYEEFEAYVCGK